ncbi:hypothetical protein ACF073_22120 [Streptomyces sp. NPDC015171]|uniref:hypothetical protein n=1 Tax=Streptomyces sp. NPDC015171 TaxID=3364945 RepID=UPI0036F81A0F
MDARANPPSSGMSDPAAGGDEDHPAATEFAPAHGTVYAVVPSGDAALTAFGWLRLPVADLPRAAARWTAFRAELHEDPALNIRPDDDLRARKLAAGQGRPLGGAYLKRGPNRTEKWNYRRVLRRGIDVIAALPGTTVGTAGGHGLSTAVATEALLKRLAAERAADVCAAFALIRTGNGSHSWYRLPTGAEAPRRVEGPPNITADAERLVEPAEFVAYCAYRHWARLHERRLLPAWFPELLPGAEGPHTL